MSGTGKLIVISSPSGGGKGSIISRLMENDPELIYSISATTRPPRDGERNGQDYIFLTESEFKQWRKADKFMEWAEVHDGYYGTPKEPIAELLKTGNDIVLELDVQGMRQVRESKPGELLSIFIMPPSIEELERRLRIRGDLSEDQIRVRLHNAEEEIASKDEFDHVVVNADLDEAVKKVELILQKKR